jgi:hypothetical protein
MAEVARLQPVVQGLRLDGLIEARFGRPHVHVGPRAGRCKTLARNSSCVLIMIKPQPTMDAAASHVLRRTRELPRGQPQAPALLGPRLGQCAVRAAEHGASREAPDSRKNKVHPIWCPIRHRRSRDRYAQPTSTPADCTERRSPLDHHPGKLCHRRSIHCLPSALARGVSEASQLHSTQTAS